VSSGSSEIKLKSVSPLSNAGNVSGNSFSPKVDPKFSLFRTTLFEIETCDIKAEKEEFAREGYGLTICQETSRNEHHPDILKLS